MPELNLNELQIDDTKNEVEVKEDNVFSLPDTEFNLPLRIKTFNNEKDFRSFIKNVEKLIRASNEYKLWTKYITEYLGETECAFTNEKITECPLAIHHHPITLYVIVEAVVTEIMAKGLEFSTFDVATKVIELHFQNKVGYVVLLSDLHSKYHSGFLNIPIELIHGEYKHILLNYPISDEEHDRICKLCTVNIEDITQTWQKDNYPGMKSVDIVKQDKIEE